MGDLENLKHALDRLPAGLFVVTAFCEGRRAGVAARSVQVCANEPVLLAVAVRTGHWIEPLIRDSRHFCVCSIERSETLLMRKFADPARPRDGDPFDALLVDRMTSGAPVLASSEVALECEVVRHMDLEADHELYVGAVIGGRYRDAQRGNVRFEVQRPEVGAVVGATVRGEGELVGKKRRRAK